MRGPYDFGLIGHLESWGQAYRMMEQWRKPEAGGLDREEIRNMYGWIPPREIFEIQARSIHDGRWVRGVYVESFIVPDELDRSHFFKNVEKVRKSAKRAGRLQAGTVTLGGFTSIVLEGNTHLEEETCAFTTGNSLTAALIVKGLEQVCVRQGVDLKKSTLGVIGSTGDIGTAVCRYFVPKVERLLLCARNRKRLDLQLQELQDKGKVAIGGKGEEVLREANVLVCVASTEAPTFDLALCQQGAIVCDAGYPKNMRAGEAEVTVFAGGMGKIEGGVRFLPEEMEEVYQLAKDNVGHGCLLESVLLAMEGRRESFSRGRGNIGLAEIEEIWSLAEKHGIGLALD